MIGVMIAVLIVIIAGYFLIIPYNETNTAKSDSGATDTSLNSVDSAKTASVMIKDFSYSPKELRIKVGTLVVWTNADSVGHTVTSDTGDEIGSLLLKNGESYTKTFNTPGIYPYHCKPHPYMKGKIIVEE